MFTMRFDMRAPGQDATARGALYRAAIDMAAGRQPWLRDGRRLRAPRLRGRVLPSPFPMAAALAAVTTTTPIVVAAAFLPLYDPVRLAEDLIVIDHISGGRAMFVLALGYRPVEYELHGVDFGARGRIADEKLAALLDVLRGVLDGAARRHTGTVLAGRAVPRGVVRRTRRPAEPGATASASSPRPMSAISRPPTSRPPATPGTSRVCASSRRRTPRRRSSSTTTSTSGGRRSARRCSRTRCRTSSGTRRRAAPTTRPACRGRRPSRTCGRRGLAPRRHRGRGDRPRPHARHAVAAAPLRWPRSRGGLAVPPSGRRRRGPGGRRGRLSDGGPGPRRQPGRGSRGPGRCPA